MSSWEKGSKLLAACLHSKLARVWIAKVTNFICKHTILYYVACCRQEVGLQSVYCSNDLST